MGRGQGRGQGEGVTSHGCLHLDQQVQRTHMRAWLSGTR
jgi:hypothetical protein